jgi:hypothetical protein
MIQPIKPILAISTGTIAQRGEQVLNITRKSSGDSLGLILAPTWELVAGHKRSRHPEDKRWQNAKPLTDKQYTDGYLALLRTRYDEERAAEKSSNGKHKNRFHQIIEMGAVTFVCYCPADDFCHRHIAVDVIKKIAEKLGYDVLELGEVTQLACDNVFSKL